MLYCFGIVSSVVRLSALISHILLWPPGLIKLGEGLGLNLVAPREKITVLLIGNHSAGKSSFVNW